MPAVVRGGVWTNVEDEILKASISKYGLQQWARISSLLPRKSAKQCKARWTEWLDPSIKKTEWSKEEDEKLLHMAKIMHMQWRTIASIVGRTANQSLERYNQLLSDAEAVEASELSLAGPGAESRAPTADDIRRLRPGELDPDPETRRALPDAIDMDEDEKEMLSEARARLANTQGKKAKRKAREKQIQETKRLANLQKRRELKAAGISTRITYVKKGQMDYNADIPFEKKPALGFYDTTKEKVLNEAAVKRFDPKKMDTEKRQGEKDDNEANKRQRKDGNKETSKSAQLIDQARAKQLERIREAEMQVKRRKLVLPTPQVSDKELEDIVKMGLSGDQFRTPAPLEQMENRSKDLRRLLAALPKPENEIELVLPEDDDMPDIEQDNVVLAEDAAERDRRIAELAENNRQELLNRRSQVIRRSLPRPKSLSIVTLSQSVRASASDDIEALISEEAAKIIAHDARTYPLPGSQITGSLTEPFFELETANAVQAWDEIRKEISNTNSNIETYIRVFDNALTAAKTRNDSSGDFPIQDKCVEQFEVLQEYIGKEAWEADKIGKRLAAKFEGYQARSTLLSRKISEAYSALEKARTDLRAFEELQTSETGAIPARIEALQLEVDALARRERYAQADYSSL